MAYSVRRTTADEWRDYRELRLAALIDSPTNFGQTHEQALAIPDETWQERARTNATSDLQAFFVAVDDTTGKLVGMWGVMPHNAHPGVHHVLGVYVRPEARGTEVARLLNQACVDFARTTDAKDLTLLVRDDNDRGRRFYEREGFELTGAKQPHNLDPSHNLLEMRYQFFR
ncbi:ribosomal protein S18 acetylase RimI-like enzyme [Catenulispora sp. MAP5-51]|jgi:ribosomal protein S18 acetylase RimI-like enzyme|uniref:GNAT family N-acetyltransferase n=1 Tax=Catenulispora sp. MAP5-51 TaxID=3156298 RepID=UPI003516C79C